MHFLQIALQLFNIKNVKYVSIVFVILVAFQNSPHSIGCHKIFITYLNVWFFKLKKKDSGVFLAFVLSSW